MLKSIEVLGTGEEIAIPDEPQYAHRNGETDAPTADGFYWYLDNDTEYQYGVVNIVDGYVFGSLSKSDDGYLELFEGQWWGPVVPPWELDE